MTDSESLTERLRAAVQAVDAAGVPDDLREIAFTRALDALLGAPGPSQSAADSVATAAPQESAAASRADGDGPVVRLARKLGIDERTAQQVYDIDEDGLHLVLSPAKFNTKVTYAMQEIAQLIVAGRQASGLDEDWTSADEIRKACESRGLYSPGNFATQVKKIERDGFRARGSGRNREFKASAVGFEKAGELAARLTQQE